MEEDKYMHYVQNRMKIIFDNNIYQCEDGNKQFNQNNFDMQCAFMDNDLLWWKNNSSQFPLMKHLARKYLSVPATSCASERAASTSGNVVTNYRTRLLPENVNMSCVLHDNDYLTEMFQVIKDKDGQRKLVVKAI